MKPPGMMKPFGGGGIKPMPMPEAPEIKRAVSQAGTQFAYHAPPSIALPQVHPRMKRPKGGHGPHN